MPRPPGPLFVFNLFPYDRLLDMADLVRLVKAGEDAGFDIVSGAEHLFPPPASHELLHNRTWWDLPALFSFLAAHTTRIRLMLGVSVIPYHEPINFAKALTTLDHVSNGRLILGVGTGWYEEEARNLGYNFNERGDITDEYVAAMIELWTSDTPTFKGKYVSFEDVSFYPKPVQKPHPLLIMGGTGQRPFRRTAKFGQGWNPMVGSLEENKEHMDRIRALTREQGRDPEELWFMRRVSWSFGDADRAAQHVRTKSGPGDVDPTTEDVIAQIQANFDAGCNAVAIGFGWETADDYIRQLEQVGREVIPRFR